MRESPANTGVCLDGGGGWIRTIEGVSQQIYRRLKFHIFLMNSMAVPSIPEQLCPFPELEATRFSMTHCWTLSHPAAAIRLGVRPTSGATVHPALLPYRQRRVAAPQVQPRRSGHECPVWDGQRRDIILRSCGTAPCRWCCPSLFCVKVGSGYGAMITKVLWSNDCGVMSKSWKQFYLINLFKSVANGRQFPET